MFNTTSNIKYDLNSSGTSIPIYQGCLPECFKSKCEKCNYKEYCENYKSSKSFTITYTG